jgi:hypothetical protein
MNGSVIGTRTYNNTNSELIFTNGATAADFVWNKGKMLGKNAFRVDNALFRGDVIMESCNGVNNILDNYANLEVRNYTATSSTINNHDSGVIRGEASTFNIVNNYDDGQVQFDSASAVHIINNGYMKLTSFTVDADSSVYNESIKNGGVLDLESDVNIGDKVSPTTYGIFLSPVSYRQTKVNIGKPDDTSQSVNIYANDTGITGDCYYYPRRHQYYYSGSGSNRNIYSYTDQKIKYLDGTSEYFDQSLYDQDLCVVNMYTGYVSSKEYPYTYVRAVAIPISNTLENGYTYWHYDSDGTRGLKVIPRSGVSSLINLQNQARIGSQEYLTIQDAIDSVPEGGSATIDVINYAVNAKSIVIP